MPKTNQVFARVFAVFLPPLRSGLFLGLVTLVGCGGKDRVELPDFDPDGAGTKAMELFDSNGDGAIAGDELDACPGVKAGLKQTDSDGDGRVTKAEIAARVQSWLDSDTGGLPAAIQVTYKGKPLDGANVVFEPEPFLEGIIFPAKGITSPSGRSELACEKLPFGSQAGFYRVRFTHDEKELPAKYNTHTEIGAEVSNESDGINRGRFEFQLK